MKKWMALGMVAIAVNASAAAKGTAAKKAPTTAQTHVTAARTALKTAVAVAKAERLAAAEHALSMRIVVANNRIGLADAVADVRLRVAREHAQALIADKAGKAAIRAEIKDQIATLAGERSLIETANAAGKSVVVVCDKIGCIVRAR